MVIKEIVEINVDIDDYVHEIDTDTLIEELTFRKLSSTEKGILKTFLGCDEVSDEVKNLMDNEIHFNPDSLRDFVKLEVMAKKYKDVPEADLEEFFNKY